MEYNQVVFDKIAVPRIKRYYGMNKEYFLAQAMDYKDFMQDMSIILWQSLTRYKDLTEDDYGKLVNTVLSKKMISARRQGFKHMKAFEVTDEQGDIVSEDIKLLGHSSQFINIDNVDEALLIDKNSIKDNRGLLNLIKNSFKEEEYNLIKKLIIEDYSELEMACEVMNCSNKGLCKTLFKSNKSHTRENNIGKEAFKSNCAKYEQLHRKSMKIHRLKIRLIGRIKKLIV